MLARTVHYFDLSRTLPRKLRLPWHCSLKVLASQRLGKNCQHTVFPGEAVEHVNAPTALGFGRASGLTKRPCLHQPEYVHKVLGEIALTKATGALKFRQLKIDLPPAPKIKYVPLQRKRLTGKQAAPAAYQTQKARKKVTSFKNLLADVQWTPQELEHINQANGWREKQRLEKKITIIELLMLNVNTFSKFPCQVCQMHGVPAHQHKYWETHERSMWGRP